MRIGTMPLGFADIHAREASNVDTAVTFDADCDLFGVDVCRPCPDPIRQKAVVPGATVVVTNEGTNAALELITNEAGLFTAPLLPAGTYSITVTLSGFTPFKRTGIVLNATETVRLPVELSVGALDQGSRGRGGACRERPR